MPWEFSEDVEPYAERVVLFTDLGNPAPNKVYQRIGFRPVSDHRAVRFATLNPPKGV